MNIRIIKNMINFLLQILLANNGNRSGMPKADSLCIFPPVKIGPVMIGCTCRKKNDNTKTKLFWDIFPDTRINGIRPIIKNTYLPKNATPSSHEGVPVTQ